MQTLFHSYNGWVTNAPSMTNSPTVDLILGIARKCAVCASSMLLAFFTDLQLTLNITLHDDPCQTGMVNCRIKLDKIKYDAVYCSIYF